MLILTNRKLLDGPADETAFSTQYTPASESVGLAHVRQGNGGRWLVEDVRDQATDEALTLTLLPLLAGPRPVLFYLHGNNNTPAACFARCAVLEAMYDLEVIGWSWPSEGFLPDGSQLAATAPDSSGDDANLKGVRADNRTTNPIQDKIQRYHQAKTNAKNGIDALARALRLLGLARLAANEQRFSIAAHSLGAHFLQNTLAVASAAESLGTAHNVVLLAPCVRAAGHKIWLARLRPQGQVFVTFNQADLVLAGARIADNDEIKLGADPGSDPLVAPSMRYVDFTGAHNDLAQHSYFVRKGLSGKPKKVLGRILGSEQDIQAQELPRKVYPVGCDERLLTCFMAAPSEPGT